MPERFSLHLLVAVAMRRVAGRAARRTEIRATTAASRSVLECRASEIMPIDPETRPTTSLNTMRAPLATIEADAAQLLSTELPTSSGTEHPLGLQELEQSLRRPRPVAQAILARLRRSATLWASPSGTNTGSYPKPPWPCGERAIVPHHSPATAKCRKSSVTASSAQTKRALRAPAAHP